MSSWQQKRFWEKAEAVACDGGFAVELDGRRVRTPAKTLLIVPGLEMAEATAAEWAAQGEKIDPLEMPVTRSVNAAIDKVRVQHSEVAEMLAAYGDSDLLCYRADHPDALVARQAEQWDPALAWAETEFTARLRVHAGVLHHPQDPEALARLSVAVHRMTEFQLAGFHDLVSLSGSLVLGFAAARNWRAPEEIWDLSRLDEVWQEEHWGVDDESKAQARIKRSAFLHAKRFFDLA